jgi:2-oxo-hept-3-ene-1,7-dioate hydratase
MAGLAEALWKARVDGEVVVVGAAQAPASLAAAYEVQATMIELAGLPQVGWKLGATTGAALDLLALDEAFMGPLFASHCHQSGAEIALQPAHSPGLETEFLVGLGADLPPREAPYAAEEVASAVEFVAPAFEVIGCRFAGGLAGNGLLVIADGGGNAAIVQGAPVRDWRRFDLRRHGVRLNLNGTEAASGSSSALIFGDPIGAVAWFASQPLLAGRGLRRGEIVMTGTCTGLTPIKAGDAAVADFGELGQVRATFA